ncbi:MAG: hypothetical protein H7233_12315 [Pseudorhodobacter sp.]|nr:hypothetical protein [Frankiaceae bacterium]
MDRPEVSITDPSRPSSGPDMRDDGRVAGRRPGWRAWTAVAALLVVVAGTTAAVRVRDDRARQRRLEAAALAALQVTVLEAPYVEGLVDQAVDNGTAVALALRNDGPVQERVVALQVLAPGWSRQRLDVTLPVGGLQRVDVTPGGSCTPALLSPVPLQARVTLQTARGQLVERDVDLADQSIGLVIPARNRCHYLPTDAQLRNVGHSSRQRGRVLTVRVGIANAGRTPLQMSRPHTTPGFTVTSSVPFPLVLAPQSRERVTYPDVVLTLTVVDCARARAEVRGAASGLGPRFPGSVQWDLQGATGPGDFAVDLDQDPAVVVAKACGDPLPAAPPGPGLEAVPTAPSSSG